MIRRAVALLFFISSSTCFATSILPDSGQVTLKLNDNSIVSIKTCEEYISLRKAGKEIVDYPHLPDRFVEGTADNLVDCYLNSYAMMHGYSQVKPALMNVNIRDIIMHFPASAGVIVSDYEAEEIEKNFAGKTIFQREDDLRPVDDKRAISDKHADGYYLSKVKSYRNNNGKVINYVTVVNYVTDGTWASVTTYEVKNKNTKIWQLKKVTVNSPL